MKKLLRVFIILALAFGAFATGAQEEEEENLLINPGFEAPYLEQGGDPVREVAQGWTAWHIPRASDEPTWRNRQPVYVAATEDEGRVRSGENAQTMYNDTWWAHDGGLYQLVTVPDGTEVRFSVYVYVWSSNFDDIDVSRDPGDVTVQVGIDPTGGTDPESDDIEWSIPVQQYDAFRQYSQIAVADGDTISVWIRSTVDFPVQNTFVYIDDAVLSPTVDGDDEPVDDPTETPVDDPTEEPTEEPTDEPDPTGEPEETEEPTDEPVETEELATDTPEPTATDLPTATATAIPTDTPQPTDTPLPLFTRPPDEDPTPTLEIIDLDPTATPSGIIDPVPVDPTVAPTVQPTLPASPEPDETFLNTVSHTVRRGDTVSRLAALYGSTIQAINRANDLNADNLIFVGQQLIIPVPIAAPATSTPSPTPIPSDTPVPTPTEEIVQPPPAGETTYTVQRGDTLSTIARRFDSTVAAIAQRNGIANVNRIFVGQQLVIPAGTPPPPAAPTPEPEQPSEPQTYVVRPGDTLFRISARFGVSLDAIVQANGIVNRNLIFVGQVLTIP